MNFIYIHTHDSGRYMQPYGIGTDNPSFMRFARESFMFHEAYCAAPTCSCSRTGLLSGMAPHSAGMFGLAHRGFHMQDFGQHLSHFLHDNGYYTALAGVQHEAISPELLGYDEFYTAKEISESRRIPAPEWPSSCATQKSAGVPRTPWFPRLISSQPYVICWG